MDLTRRDAFTLGAATLAASALPGAIGTAAAQTSPATGQAPGFYRVKIGDFVVTQLYDGQGSSPIPQDLVRNVALADVQKTMENLFLPTDVWTNSFTPLVVDTGARRILLDTGFADNGAPTTGALRANMRAAGIDPGTITHVVISHFHGDHISGIRDKAGALVYPNAEIMVPAQEWAFWMDDARMEAAPEAQKAAFRNVRRVFGPIAGDVKRYEWGKEIVSGITTVDASGHTPGHTAFVIASGNGRMIFVADLTNNPLIFARNPEWKFRGDQDPDKAIASRRKVLDMVAADRMRVAFYHAPFPATGHIAKTASGYDFVAERWSSTL